MFFKIQILCCGCLWSVTAKNNTGNNAAIDTSNIRPWIEKTFSVYNLTRSPLTATLYYLNAWNRLESSNNNWRKHEKV